MPEGPEVAIVTDWLQRIVGAQISSIKYNRAWVEKVPRDTWHSLGSGRSKTSSTDLSIVTGRTITEVRCYGKRIFMFLDHELILVSALGMEGMWTHKPWRGQKAVILTLRLLLPADSIPQLGDSSDSSGSESDDEAEPEIVETAGTRKWTLCYQNTRPIGYLGLLPVKHYTGLISEFGIDLLLETPSRIEWAEALTRLQDTTLKYIFAKDKGVTGSIGNYLRSEIFYQARIDPHRKTGSLSTAEVNRLRVAAITITRKAYAEGGMTSNSFYSPEREAGNYEALVYGRTKDSEGHRILKEKAGQSLYWVPEVQK